MLWYKSNVIGNVNLIVISSFTYECTIFGFVTPFFIPGCRVYAFNLYFTRLSPFNLFPIMQAPTLQLNELKYNRHGLEHLH